MPKIGRGYRESRRLGELIRRLEGRMEEDMECEKENVASKRSATEKLLDEIHEQVSADVQDQDEWKLARGKRKKLESNKIEKDMEGDMEREKSAKDQKNLVGGKSTTLVKSQS